MALPLPPGLTPSEVAFVCEMEMVTIIPRQRLEGMELLGVSKHILSEACSLMIQLSPYQLDVSYTVVPQHLTDAFSTRYRVL